MNFEMRTAVRAPPGSEHTRVESLQGALHLDRVSLRHPELDIAFHELRGSIRLHPEYLEGEGIEGRYHDHRARLDIRYPDASNGFTMNAVLDSTATGLKQELSRRLGTEPGLHRRLGEALSGRTTWTGTVHRQERGAWVADFQSDLRGLKVGLPAPLGKEAEHTAPLEFLARFAAHTAPRFKLRYRGQVLHGAPEDGVAGLHWQGTVPPLSVEEWQAWLPPSSGDSSPRVPHGLNLDLEFEALSWRGHDYALRLQTAHTPLTWEAVFDGAQIQGLVRIPHGTDPTWEVLLERFLYPQRNDASEQTRPGGRLPQARVAIEELRLEWAPEYPLRMELDSRRQPNGVDLAYALSLTGEGLALAGTGRWQPDAAGSGASTIRANLEFDRLARFLHLAGESQEGITGAPGNIALMASWQGPPDGISLAELDGTLRLDFGAGTLQRLDTGGAWVFGLLSLQTPLNILTLDPLKPFKQGLTFDRIHGEFEIHGGHARTEGLKLEGDMIELTVAGRSGLVLRDYEQVVTAVPNLYASLPVTGLLFGPAGLGAGYALSILGGLMIKGLPESINQVARKRYRITGSWNDPTVEEMAQAPPHGQTQIELQKP